MPQFAYGNQPRFLNGQIADPSAMSVDSFVNEIVAQQSNIAGGGVAAAAAEVYQITAEGADGSLVTVAFTATGGESVNAVITALVAAWNSDPIAAGLGTATDNTGDLDIDFVAVGVAFTVTATQGLNVTLAVTTPTAAGGAVIGLAVAVQYGAADESAIAAGAGMVDADVIGMTVRNLAIQVQDTPSGTIVNDEFAPGEMLSVMRQGTLIALAEEAVTKGAAVFVRIANVTVAGDPLGMPRSDVAGGDAIALTGARFGATTTGRALVKIEINRPA